MKNRDPRQVRLGQDFETSLDWEILQGLSLLDVAQVYAPTKDDIQAKDDGESEPRPGKNGQKRGAGRAVRSS